MVRTDEEGVLRRTEKRL